VTGNGVVRGLAEEVGGEEASLRNKGEGLVVDEFVQVCAQAEEVVDIVDLLT
jgi:hypothetical protein